MKQEIKIDKIEQLARKHHAFFVYDLDIINKQISRLRNLPENVEIFYAMKANPHKSIINLALKNRLIKGIEIASQGEAEKVLAVTDNLKRVIYTGPSKRPKELDFVMNKEIQLINVESITEAHRIQRLALKKQNILLRINVNREIHGAVTKMSSAKEPSPFGVSEEEAADVIKEIEKMDKLSLQGLHIFSATGVMDAKALLAHIDYSLSFSNKMEKQTGINFSTIDFGGGIGIDYMGKREFDLEYFSLGLKKLIKKHNMQNKRLVLELGRYIVADSGLFCTKINDIKLSRGKKIILCTAGINAHRRPFAMKTSYAIEILHSNRQNLKYPGQLGCQNENVEIRGPLCTEADVLSYNTFVKGAEIEDFVIMHKSGAYGLTMSAIDFLSYPRVHEFVIGGKNA